FDNEGVGTRIDPFSALVFAEQHIHLIGAAGTCRFGTFATFLLTNCEQGQGNQNQEQITADKTLHLSSTIQLFGMFPRSIGAMLSGSIVKSSDDLVRAISSPNLAGPCFCKNVASSFSCCAAESA